MSSHPGHGKPPTVARRFVKQGDVQNEVNLSLTLPKLSKMTDTVKASAVASTLQEITPCRPLRRSPRSALYEEQSDTSADELAAEELTAKRHKHGVRRSAGINASKVAPKPSAPPHTVAGEVKEPKRRIKPSQKLIENKSNTVGNRGSYSRSRHQP